MAFQVVHLIYKLWPSFEKWLGLPVQAAMEAFGRGQRHDSLGNWGRLSAVDPSSGVPRELGDDEVLAYGRARGQEDDPTGEHSLGRFRTNQVISRFVRGAIQLGYQRQHFNVANHIREGTEADTGMVHSSCAALLSRLVAKVTGCRHYSMLPPRNNNTPSYIFSIDPFGICQMYSPRDCTIQLIAMMIGLSIPIQAKFTITVTQARQRGPDSVYQGQALRHLPGGSMLPPGRSSILDQPVTAEEAAEVANTRAKAKPKPKSRANTPDPHERKRQNQETYTQKWGDHRNDRRWDRQHR